MKNLQLFNTLINNINSACDSIETNQGLVKSYIETIDKENNKISQSIGYLESIFGTKTRCKTIPFGIPPSPKEKTSKTLYFNLA